jgi:hypothetical protein
MGGRHSTDSIMGYMWLNIAEVLLQPVVEMQAAGVVRRRPEQAALREID